MRRSANGWHAALALFLFVNLGCSVAPPKWAAGAVMGPACPRDAARDPSSGRCECASDTLPVLGACVTPAVGDSFCGAAAIIGRDGCTFRSCGNGDVLDVASGSCIALAGDGRRGKGPEGRFRCAEQGVGLIENAQAVCVPPDAACPRGTQRNGTSPATPERGQNPDGGLCTRSPRCPPGTLPTPQTRVGSGPTPQTRVGSGPTPQTRVGSGPTRQTYDETTGPCRPITTIKATSGRRVDIGAWTAIALGIDGGPGSPELCRPLLQRPALFGLTAGQILALRIRVTLTIPDEDLARLHAEVTGVAGSGRQANSAANAAIESAVVTLLEPLRSLGGESSAAAVETSVTCEVARLPEDP